MFVVGDIWLGTEGIGAISRQARGSYVLLICLDEEKVINVGSLGDTRFSAGFYAYVGSAMNRLKARLERHLRSEKRRHWHIDYLLEKAVVIDMAVRDTDERVECLIARALGNDFQSIPGFGSSDCRCRSHLFFEPEEGRIRNGIRYSINTENMVTG